MAPKKRLVNNASKTSTEPDGNNGGGLTSTQLRAALRMIGIQVPTSLTKTALKALYKENGGTSATSTDGAITSESESNRQRNRSRSPIDNSNSSDNTVTQCLRHSAVPW